MPKDAHSLTGPVERENDIEVITKTWGQSVIQIKCYKRRWVKCFAGSTTRNWVKRAASYKQLCEMLAVSETNPLITVASYQTRVVLSEGGGKTGIYHVGFLPVMDDEDLDITRNLQAIDLTGGEEGEGL